MKNLIHDLELRGFIASLTSHEIYDLANQPIPMYLGFDPTSDSLHLGNLVGIVALSWFERYGHKPIVLIGGATGMIGDPSGKSVERVLLSEGMVEKNVKGIEKTLQNILQSGNIKFLNNLEWFKDFTFIEFLRDVGKNFRLSSMLAKDSVKIRLTSEEGLSFTEFSYQLFQAYDFLYLYDKHQVILQMGGNDQWGNITAGTELVRKIRNQTVFGATFPLLTRSDGKKFGKTEEGAIWLSSDKLSEYEFYQYLFRLPDSDIIQMMKMLTFMPLEEIQAIEEEMKSSSYRANSAQKKLAEEVTLFVHGKEGLKRALTATQLASPGEKTELGLETLELLSREIPSLKLTMQAVLGKETAELFVLADLSSSKGEAKRLILGKGAYLNNMRLEDPHHRIEEKDFLHNRFLLLAVGKKKKRVLEIES